MYLHEMKLKPLYVIFYVLFLVVKLSLDVDSFNKLIDKLWGVEPNGGNGVSSGPTPLPSREVTKLTNQTNVMSNLSGQSTGALNQPLEAKFSRTSPSRMATCGTPRRKPREVSQHTQLELKNTSESVHAPIVLRCLLPKSDW